MHKDVHYVHTVNNEIGKYLNVLHEEMNIYITVHSPDEVSWNCEKNLFIGNVNPMYKHA